jgi:transcriptional regulator with XRE-family HTH domain
MSTLSERLTMIMEQKNIKQADLMRATGASRPAIHSWLSGSTKNLKGENLVKTAEFLGVRTDWLAYGTGSIETQWPFSRVSPNDMAVLSAEAIEDIEDIILLKINKAKQTIIHRVGD